MTFQQVCHQLKRGMKFSALPRPIRSHPNRSPTNAGIHFAGKRSAWHPRERMAHTQRVIDTKASIDIVTAAAAAAASHKMPMMKVE